MNGSKNTHFVMYDTGTITHVEQWSVLLALTCVTVISHIFFNRYDLYFCIQCEILDATQVCYYFNMVILLTGVWLNKKTC